MYELQVRRRDMSIPFRIHDAWLRRSRELVLPIDSTVAGGGRHLLSIGCHAGGTAASTLLKRSGIRGIRCWRADSQGEDQISWIDLADISEPTTTSPLSSAIRRRGEVSTMVKTCNSCKTSSVLFGQSSQQTASSYRSGIIRHHR